MQDRCARPRDHAGGVKRVCQYLMSLTETFYSTNGCIKKAALILGKQPDSNVYVFGDKMQVRNINIRKFM
jgi:hypothetical protein